MNFSAEEVKQIRDALMANGIFHTPITRLRLKNAGAWGDFEEDAHMRTIDTLAMLDAKS